MKETYEKAHEDVSRSPVYLGRFDFFLRLREPSVRGHLPIFAGILSLPGRI